MSFVDELNNYKDPQEPDNSHLMIGHIVGAIRDICIRNRDKHYVQGYYYTKSEPYTFDKHEIVEQKDCASSFFVNYFEFLGTTKEAFKKNLLRAISDLGFKSYNIKIIDVLQKREVKRYVTTFGNEKIKYENAPAFIIYVELRW